MYSLCGYFDFMERSKIMAIPAYLWLKDDGGAASIGCIVALFDVRKKRADRELIVK